MNARLAINSTVLIWVQAALVITVSRKTVADSTENASGVFVTFLSRRYRTCPTWTWPPTCRITTNPRTCWTLRKGCPAPTACLCTPSPRSPPPTWSGTTAPSPPPVKVGSPVCLDFNSLSAPMPMEVLTAVTVRDEHSLKPFIFADSDRIKYFSIAIHRIVSGEASSFFGTIASLAQQWLNTLRGDAHS